MNTSLAAIRKTPLENWIAHRIDVAPGTLTPSDLSRYQVAKLRQTLGWVRERSSFYSRHLSGFDESSLRSMEDVRRIPFTTAADLSRHASRFLCVSQDEIQRVVTLASSGTSGEPKRLFFTASDQESALDFFEHGVSTLAERGDTMLIALPGERHGSVGNLLAKGIERSGVRPVAYGLISNPADVLETMARECATSIIGFPVQLLCLANQRGRLADRVFSKLRSIVLCSDHVPSAAVRTLQQRAGCEVFEHYGMTEMGLGGGVDCQAHAGYHLREADLLFEIVDVRSGEPMPDGEMGEVVFSTLTRQGMPLIRYRTGDISGFSAERCPCGTMLKTLQRIRERSDGRISLGPCGEINMAVLDDALFEVPGLVDFAAILTRATTAELRIVCQLLYTEEQSAIHSAVERLEQNVIAIERGRRSGELRLRVEVASKPFVFNGAKRRIEVRGEQ